jgi:hypothetical protein
MPENPLPDYEPYPSLSDDDCADPGVLLRAHARWLTANADRFIIKQTSPGVVSDAITKTVDQMIDWHKERSDPGAANGGQDIAAVIAQVRAGLDIDSG